MVVHEPSRTTGGPERNTLEMLMDYSLSEAGKAARVAKSTVLRAIKAGRLSARREDDGTYRIDASELARVYDLQHLTRIAEGALNHGAPVDPERGLVAMDDGSVVDLLRLELRHALDHLAREREERERERLTRDQERNTILERERSTVDDLRKRLDRSEERVLALSAPPAQMVPQTVQDRSVDTSAVLAQAKPSKGFLSRLLGR